MQHTTTEQWLKRAWKIEDRARREKEKITELRSTLYEVRGVSYDNVRVQTSGGDTMGDKVARLADLERRYVDDVVDSELMKCETLTKIHTLDDDPEESLLYLRYIRRLNYYEIAEEMDRSLRYLHRLHNEAIAALSEKLETAV